MKKNVKKYGVMTIAAVLLVALAFAGAASAENVAPESFTGTIPVNGSVNGGWPTLDQSVSVTDGYYIKNESNWRAVVESVNTGETTYTSANLVLTNDIVFTAEVPSLGNSSAKKFQGHIYGNGYKIVNFTQSGAEAHGLIYYAGDGCALNYVQMVDCNIASTSQAVGGFIGLPDCGSSPWGDMIIWGCSLKYSNVTSTSKYVGGITGLVKNTNILINASCIDHVYISGPESSGFSSRTESSVNLTDCWIEGSQVNKSCGIGTIATMGIKYTSCFTNVTVKECNICGGGNTGGLIGRNERYAIIDGCSVENSSVGIPNLLKNSGALMGSGAGVTYKGEQSWARYCWVNHGEGATGWQNGSMGSIMGGGDAVTVEVAPGHEMVCSPLYPDWYQSKTGFDNNFDGNTSDGVGSLIGKGLLIAGTHYGYGSARYITYDANGATSGTAPANQTAAYGSQVTVAGKGDLAKSGYTFRGWYNESTGLLDEGDLVTIHGDLTMYANWSAIEYTITYNNMTGATNPEANPATYNITSPAITLVDAYKPGYAFENWYNSSVFTDASRNKTIPAGSAGDKVFYANWTAIEYNITVSGNNVTFPANLSVGSVKFDTNSDVTAVAFKYEAPQGTPQKGGFTVDTIGDPFTLTPTGSLNGTKAVVNFNITSAQMESYNPENIRLAHYVGSAWTFVKPTYNGLIADNHTFSAEIDSMSPFAVVSYVEDPKPTYSPSSSKQTGSTVILQEGQTAPTASATAAPTVAPTVKPTEQPATPTVIATEKPTTQATQQSPAPFLGILAGLGAAAVLLRLRK